MTVPTGQAPVAALLRGLAGRDPVETHISAVFLGTDTVWKLKKAVTLSFVDFSTLAERERTARREFELNAPHAPGLYRDVVPVVRAADGALRLGGAGAGADGEIVDWVVRMGRVPDGDFLDEVAARGALSPALQDELGDAVAALHQAYPVAAVDHAAALRRVVAGNGQAARAAGLEPGAVARWEAGAQALIARHAAWLAGRAAAGFVRRAHGDLHLGNLCLWQGRVEPFDALEFDEDLATIDTGYDLAFLLMDLDVRVGRPAANRVMNRYLARTGDFALVTALPLFLSLRAMVRAHVEAARGRAAESAGYLARALGYQAPAAARVVAVGGLPGTGKSTLARALAPGLGAAPGAVVLRSDEIRKRRHGAAPETKLPPEAYGAGASKGVFGELFAAAAEIGAAGHAVVADATFMDPADRDAIAAAAGDVPFLGVWLQAPIAELERRIAARRGDASDADVAVLRRAAASRPEAGRWLAVEASDGAAALDMVRAALDPRA